MEKVDICAEFICQIADVFHLFRYSKNNRTRKLSSGSGFHKLRHETINSKVLDPYSNLRLNNGLLLHHFEFRWSIRVKILSDFVHRKSLLLFMSLCLVKSLFIMTF